MAGIPFIATYVVGGIEDLAEFDVAELGYGEKGGGFHFDYEGAFGLPEGDFGRCFAEECVGGPSFAYKMRDVAFDECFLEIFEYVGGHGDFPCGGEIVIGDAFVSNGR